MFGNHSGMGKDTILAGGLVLFSLLWLGADAAHEAFADRNAAITASQGSYAQAVTEGRTRG
jgi:hypothetical protein